MALPAIVTPVFRAAETAPRAPTPPTSTAPAFSGALENGIRFTIQPHGIGLGRISVRLIVHSGSLDERDHELGYAHIVEHMAFNGTRRYPPGQLIQLFQRLGLTFGPDLCGNTFFDHTTYRLDLPAGRAAELAEALEVLRDFADGLEFPAAEVQREKGVVLSELAARDNADRQLDRQRLESLYAGTLLPQRFPIGTRESIERATDHALRAYYQRCYRPDRMTVVVVGDVTIEAARALVNQSFHSLSSPGARLAPVALTAPASGLHAHLIANPRSPAATAAIVSLARRDATNAGRQEATARQLVMEILDQRLAERRSEARNRFGDADAITQEGPTRHFRHYTLSASAAGQDWPAALHLIETELRRARESGFTAAEVRERVSAHLAQQRAERDAIAGQTPDLVADRIAHLLALGETWRSPALTVTGTEQYLAGFTPAIAQSTLQTLFSEDRLHLLLYSPHPPEGGGAALLAAYRESTSRPLETNIVAAGANLEFRYGDLGPAGMIAERRTEADLSLSVVRFANDVRLNVRASTTEPGRFRLVARFGRGLPDLPREKPGLPHLAAHLIGESDLGRHTREEVGRLLALRAVSFHAGFANQLIAIMEGPAAELPFALQLLTAHVADLRLEESRLKIALSSYEVCRLGQLDDSASHAHQAAMLHMASDDPRLRMPPSNDLRNYSFEEIAAWAKTHCLGHEMELGLIGDFDSDQVIAAAAASVGTLPPRRPPPGSTAPGIALRTKPGHEVLREPLPDKVAAVQVAWPARGADDPRRWWALTFATSVMEDRLQRVLRQELGATYSPQGGLQQDELHPGTGFAYVALTFDPDRAADLARRTIDLADELARQGISEEEFLRLREPLVASAAEALRSNPWWLATVLPYVQSVPRVLTDARHFSRNLNSLTRDEVNRAARDHLRSSSASSIIVFPTIGETPSAALASAQDYNARGERRHAEGNYVGALEDFNEAIKRDPAFAPPYVNRSAHRMMRADYQGAIEDASKAIAIDSQLAMAYANRGAARIAVGDFAGAGRDLEDALRLDPGSSYAYNNRGTLRAKLGEWNEASSDFSKAIETNPGNAKAFSNRGAIKLRHADWAGAIADTLTAIQLDPTDADAHANLGSARLAKGELDAALASFTQAIELNPNVANAHFNRGKLRQARSDLDGAFADYSHAIRLNPRNADAFGNRALIHHANGRFDAAIADFSTAVTLQPNFAPFYVNRAGSRVALKDFAGAIADCDKAIALDPWLADGYNNRGFVKQNSGDLDGAIADYTKAIEVNPTLALLYNNRGNARKAKGDRLGAIDDFDRALKLGAPQSFPPPTQVPGGIATAAPPPPPATTSRAPAPKASPAAPGDGRSLVHSGDAKRLRRDFPGAIMDYTRAIAADPALAEAYHGRGMARALRNDQGGAIEDQTKAIELQPTLASAYVERGNVRRMQRDFDAAIADYDKAIELQPKVPAAHYNRGLAHQGKSDHNTALRDFETALSFNSGYVPAYNGRGYSQYSLGRFQQAVATLTEAIERSPTYVPAYYNRGLALQARGELERALRDFDQVIEASPTYLGAHASRANVRHAMGKFEDALADYNQAIASTRDTTHLPRLLRAVLQRRLQQGDPAAELAEAIKTWPGGWTKNIGRFLSGSLNETEFLAAASAGAGRAPLTRTCEAHYFAGMMCLLGNDLAGARAHFEKSVATRQPRVASHMLARAELGRLPAAGTNP